MASHYRRLADDKAFVHLFENLAETRRQLMESLVYNADGRVEQLKGSIFMIDSLVRLPDEMLQNGAESEMELRQRGEIDG